MCDLMCLACCGACAFAIFVVCVYLGVGIILIVLASRAKDAISTHQALTTQDISLYPNLCIVIGVLFTLLTLLGLAGQKMGRKTKIVYTVAQIAVGVLGLYIHFGGVYPEKNKAEKHLVEGLNNTIHQYEYHSDGSKTNYTKEWDYLQENWQCCGGNNYLDWENVKLNPLVGLVPISCCREEHRMTGCSKFVPFDNPYEANKYIYAQGCKDQIISEILGRMKNINIFFTLVLVITAIGIFESSCSSGVKKGGSDVNQKKLGPLIVRTKSKKAIKDKEMDDMEKGETSPETVENGEEEKEKLQPKVEPEAPKST